MYVGMYIPLPAPSLGICLLLVAAAFLAAQNYDHMKRYSEEFLGVPKHLYNWLCPSVGRSVHWLDGWLVGR